MRNQTLLITFMLAMASILVVAPAEAQTSAGPVTVNYQDDCGFNRPGTGVYVGGVQASCVSGVTNDGAVASFQLSTPVGVAPVLVADEEGYFYVSVAGWVKSGASYTSATPSSLGVQVLVGGSAIGMENQGGTFRFKISGEEGVSAVGVALLSANVGGKERPYSVASEALVMGGLLEEADLVQSAATVTPVMLVAPPQIPSLDADGDGVLDPVDNCSPDGDEPGNAEAGSPAAGKPADDPVWDDPTQADGDRDGIGDNCDADHEDGPLGDADGDDFPNAFETASGTDPNDPDDNPGTTAMTIVGTVTAAVADLQAFATNPDTYCADADNAGDPKCDAYKAGGDVVAIVAAAAADLQAFAADPATYCADSANAPDLKCEAYAAAVAALGEVDGVMAIVAAAAADMQAFAADPAVYCADADNAGDPKCDAYKAGGDAVALVGAAAADLQAFAADPDAYCADNAADPKCQAYVVVRGALAEAEGVAALVAAAAADLQAFATDPGAYCLDTDNADDPKCTVYMAGGEGVAAVAAAAADLQAFATNPDGYCVDNAADPKCEVYAEGAGVMALVAAAAADLQAFAADPAVYCADAANAADPKCTVYKAGGDAVALVGAAAADLQAFAADPDAYCVDNAADPKCEVYAEGAGVAALVGATAADLQAFTTDPDAYCADATNAADPKCDAYKAGGDAVIIVSTAAADLQSFVLGPDAYCRTTPTDPKCQIYTAPGASDPDGDGILGVAATKIVVRNPADDSHIRTIGDNCPDVPNAGQEDLDQDGEGDACDDDIDGDGIKNRDEDLNGDGEVQAGESDPRDKSSTTNDRDGDGHLNHVEVAAGSDPDDKKSVPDDIDGDGVANRDDKCPGHDDKVDTDGDGIPDGCDADAADGPAGDSDGDGVKNADDPFPNDPLRSLDADKDGVAEDGPAATRDNCPTIANPDQKNTDMGFAATATMPAGDGLGDACDDDDDADGVLDVDEVAAGSDPLDRASNPKDLDGDGFSNESGATPFDNCPTVANPTQINTDRDFLAVNGMPAGDGLGDACDDDDDADGFTDDAEIAAGSDPLKRASTPHDLDGDGVPNSNDLCPGHDDAQDADKDGIPDGCDADTKDGPNADRDGDGVPNGRDAFPDDPLRSSDLDGDGVADDGPEPRDNCPTFVNPSQKDLDGDGIGDACDPDNTDGPKGDKDGDGFSNKVETDAGSDPADPKSVPTDWDGDGWSNQAELDAGTDPRNGNSKPSGTAPTELEKQAQLKELSKKAGATLTGKTVFGANDTISVTLKFTAPDGAAGLQILRSNSPYQVIAALPATATTYTDTNASLNAKYMVVAYASGGVGKVLENASKELIYLPALEGEGLYYKVVKPVSNDGTTTFQNGNTQAKQVNVTVEVYDKDGKLIRVDTKPMTVPAHGTTSFDIADVNTKGGASYQVLVDGDDGERTVLASGVITQAPQIDANILWLIAGSILLAGILILMVAGIVAYARQPEESETA